MKILSIIATVLLAFAIGAFAQAGRSRPQPNQPPAAEQAPDRQPTDAELEAEEAAMQERMRQEMQDMQAHIRDMQARIEKLRRDAQRVQDPATRTALLDSVSIWESMMSQMRKNMQRMQGPGPSGGQGYDEPRRQAPQGGYDEPRRQAPQGGYEEPRRQAPQYDR